MAQRAALKPTSPPFDPQISRSSLQHVKRRCLPEALQCAFLPHTIRYFRGSCKRSTRVVCGLRICAARLSVVDVTVHAHTRVVDRYRAITVRQNAQGGLPTVRPCPRRHALGVFMVFIQPSASRQCSSLRQSYLQSCDYEIDRQKCCF